RHTRFSRDWSSDVCSSDLDFGTLARLSNHRQLFCLNVHATPPPLEQCVLLAGFLDDVVDRHDQDEAKEGLVQSRCRSHSDIKIRSEERRVGKELSSRLW